jgi:hypothetical protein
MKKITLFKGALAFAAASVIGASAHAQLTTAQGDMIFNMYSTAGPGTAYDYEVDLGNFSKFLAGGADATGSPVTLSDVSITDISGSVAGQGFGANWDTDGDVIWSVIGSQSNSSTRNGVAGHTIFATDGNVLANFSTGTVNLSNNIATYQSDITLDGINPTANSGGEGIFDGSGDDGEYTDASGGAAPFFGYLPQQFETTANGTTSVALYESLNANTNGNATDLGTFTLSSSGLTFQSVPEPSTWATVIVGAITLIGFGGFRRRRSA